MRGASNQRELVEPSRELPEKEGSNQQSAGKPPADLLLRQNVGRAFIFEDAAA